MRSRLSVLTRKELLLHYGMRNAKKEPNPARFLLILLILVGMSPAFFLYTAVSREMHALFTQINQIPGYFMSIFMLTQIVLLFTGIPAFLGRFYGNRDNSILLPMPIEPGDILVSRLVPVLLMQVIMALLIIVPAVVIHAVRAGIDLAGWLVLLTGTIASIVFPTVISAAVVLVIMRYTAFGRHTDKFKTIGILFMLVLLVGMQALIQGTAQNGLSENRVLELLTDNQALIRNTATLFIPARWTGLGMASAGAGAVLYAGLNLAVAILAAWFLQWLGTKVYLHSLLTGTEMAKEKRRSDEKIGWTARHPVLQILLTEWRILLRTPAFAVNVLSTPLIVSVVWLIPLFMNRELIGELLQMSRFLDGLGISSGAYTVIAVLVGAALGAFLSLFVETATSFSREGRAFWLRRVLPIRPSHEVIGRSLLNVLLTMATAAVLVIISFVLIRYPVWVIPVILLTAGFFSLPLTFAGLLIDVKRPKQDWDDPNQAVKQNLNSLFAMLASVAYILLFVGTGYLLFQTIREYETLFLTGTIVFVAINAVLSWVLYLVLLRTLPKAMARIE